MRSLWMGIKPGPEATRIVVLDGPMTTLLKARLPSQPRHARAIPTLCEAMALWCGRHLRVAIAAGAPRACCETTPWLDALDIMTAPPLYEIELVQTARPPRERDGLDGMGDFRDLRQLFLFDVSQ